MERQTEIINNIIESFEFLLNNGTIIKNNKCSYGYHYFDIGKNKKITGNNGFNKIVKELNKYVDKNDIALLKNENYDDWAPLFPDHMQSFIISYMLTLSYM